MAHPRVNPDSPVPVVEDGQKDFVEDDEREDAEKESINTCPSPTPESQLQRNVAGTSEDPIIHHFLTFETPLPSPTQLSNSAPECPDLKKYSDPFQWSKGRKNVLIWLSCAATGSAAYGAGSYASAVPQMEDRWHINQVVAYIGVTMFTVGFAVAPMVLAPFSEINGRRPVFLVTGFLFFVFVIVCASTPTFAGMLIARFLGGCAASTFSTMVGGVVADIYHAADRNTPMTYFTGAVMFATGLGPLISGFIAAHVNWRWVFWVHAIYVGLLVVVLVLFFKETRGSVLLSRRAEVLNKWYEARETAGLYGFDIVSPEGKRQSQRIRWKVAGDGIRLNLRAMIATSLSRPFHMLFTEPVVFFFSLWISFSWAILYMMFDIIPYMFSKVYGFTDAQSGAVFAAISIAGILATILNIVQERLALRYGKLAATPEARLYFCCVESALLPIGLFMFGWSARPSVPWIVPAIAVACATFGIFSIYLAGKLIPDPQLNDHHHHHTRRPSNTRPKPSSLQLPRRLLRSLRQLRHRSAILLPQPPRRQHALVHDPDVRSVRLRGRRQPAWRHRRAVNVGAVGPGVLRKGDTGEVEVGFGGRSLKQEIGFVIFVCFVLFCFLLGVQLAYGVIHVFD